MPREIGQFPNVLESFLVGLGPPHLISHIVQKAKRADLLAGLSYRFLYFVTPQYTRHDERLRAIGSR